MAIEAVVSRRLPLLEALMAALLVFMSPGALCV